LPTASSAKSKYYHYTPTVARIRALAMPSWWDVWDNGVFDGRGEFSWRASTKKEKKQKSSSEDTHTNFHFNLFKRATKNIKKADFTMRRAFADIMMKLIFPLLRLNRSPKLIRGHLCGYFSSLVTWATTNKVVTSCGITRRKRWMAASRAV